MTIDHERMDPNTWRAQARFRAAIRSRQQLRFFNDAGGIAVFLDVTGSVQPDIEISGSQSHALSFWETRSHSGFVTKPKFAAGLVTIRFVISGQISYLRRDGETVASPSIATLTGFEDLLEMRASSAMDAVSATLPMHSLVAANVALTGEDHRALPAFEPTADMARPGMGAFCCTVRAVQRRISNQDCQGDLLFPLIQEVMSYQLLSAWPRRAATVTKPTTEAGSRQLRLAMDYIEANLAKILTLAEIAAAAGLGVRALQIKFKKEVGQTPVQFINQRRLTRAHEEIVSNRPPLRSISNIARSWGFVHMSDFGQRYRRQFGCTPTQSRLESINDRFLF